MWGGEEIKEEMGVGEMGGGEAGVNGERDIVEWGKMGGAGFLTLCVQNNVAKLLGRF